MMRIRPAAVAGSFYPADAGELETLVHRMLDAAPSAPGPAPKALIVPHAGFVYSGPVAAMAYARLRPWRSQYRRVVLLGPGHYMGISGLALSEADYFHSPLGDVPLDHAAIAALQHPAVRTIDAAHRLEHSLEVQLPFLQCTLDAFSLVPLVVGEADAGTVSVVLDALWNGPENLVVISSDLSHYLDYEAARRCDLDTCHAIEAMDSRGIGHAQACGATPVRGLLTAARRRGMRVVTLDLRNSGDTAGDKGRVVGYGAWIFTEDESCARAA